MNKHIIAAMAAALTLAVFGEMPIKITTETQTKVSVTVEPAFSAPFAPERRVVLVVPDRVSPNVIQDPDETIRKELKRILVDNGFQVIDAACRERTPDMSVMEWARKLNADGVVTVSVPKFHDTVEGRSISLHKLSLEVGMDFTAAQNGITQYSVSAEKSSKKYKSSEISRNRAQILDDLLSDVSAECAARLVEKARSWTPDEKPGLTISEVDDAMIAMANSIMSNRVFRTNYDIVRDELGRVPLVIVAGFADSTNGGSPTSSLEGILESAAEGFRSALVATGFLDAKNDALSAPMAKRIIENGNSPLENGELMKILKRHDSPDFVALGNLRYCAEDGRPVYRFCLALYNLHDGKTVCEFIYYVKKSCYIGK